MIKKGWIFFFITVFAASSLFAGNLFSTTVSGFETSTSAWNLYKQDTSVAATIALDSVGVMFGKKYAKVTVTKVNADPVANNWYIQLQDPTWAAKKGIQYTYSCWAKVDTAGRKIHIAAQGDSASEFTYRKGQDFVLDTAWALCSYSFVSDVEGIKKMHFFVYLGYSTGIYCFDSMALDSMTVTQVRNPMALSNPNLKSAYSVQLMPECVRFVLGNSSATYNNVAVYSLEGRLISSCNIPASRKVFELPRPASGAWVVGVNSNKKTIFIP